VQTIDGRPVFAATDLVGYLACEHLTQLERAALAGLVDKPVRNDPELEIIQRRGFEHEARYLAELEAAGRRVVRIDKDGYGEDRATALREAADATLEAMRGGADVIYQATFFDGTWRGHADFLLRVDDPDRPSSFGTWHYEVADTKLARHVKASAVLQICSYIDQLERLQGVRPQWLHVALGGSKRATERLRVDDYMAYYRTARDRFLATVSETTPPTYPPTRTYPEPVEHCDVCRWAAGCAARRRADDHLSLVAGITSRQRTALTDRGVNTLAALGELSLPVVPPIEGTSAGALERVTGQARLQLAGRRSGKPIYELLLPPPGETIAPERGLATLPLPSPGDLFLDLEGDPYALDDGMDYLFGVLEADGATFHAFWSRDATGEFTAAGERAAFEATIDFIMDRLRHDPDLHVYHYAAYEPTALKRLMGRYGTREAEVDHLLRAGVLVDLLRAVRQGLRASVESYSIKKLEVFYGFERTIDLRDAGSSIVAFEQWLQLGAGERPTDDHLVRIERYNRDDVVSNLRLRDWLEGLRLEFADLTGQEVPRPTPREPSVDKAGSEAQQREADLIARLAPPDEIPASAGERDAEQEARWLLAALLGWHRREEKAMWWEYFRLMDLDPGQLVDETGALGGLEPMTLLEERRGRQTWRYSFPAQEFEPATDLHDPARKVVDPNGTPGTFKVGELVALDAAAGTIDIRLAGGASHPAAVVALNQFRTYDHRARVLTIGEWVAEHGIDADGPYRAARDLLLRRSPRIGQGAGEALIVDGESSVEAARRLVLALDHSTLAVQGPPGAGKTWTGARMILALLAAGRRVGITAMSHKVISNLLTAVLNAADEAGQPIAAVQRGEDGAVVSDPRVTRADDNRTVADHLGDDIRLAAGTSWLWVSSAMDSAVDVLFVDEAGQMSLANVLSMASATRSLVLLGDPQQLDQPLKGSHPPGAEPSALAHMLGGHATIPADRGLFLPTTWRLHPDLCRFTSEAFYESRLVSEAHLVGQRLESHDGRVDGTGPRILAVLTTGSDDDNADEARAVADLVRSLVERDSSWTDHEGLTAPIGWDDVLIVAPYNAQVAEISRLIPDGRVGTVDKFQGQEAPISVYSMTTSSPELAPRGMDFLYSRNRLNVATSRARCVAVVVMSPDLLRVRARTPRQMRLANALCRFAESAVAAQPAPAVSPPSPVGTARDSEPRQATTIEVLTLGLD